MIKMEKLNLSVLLLAVFVAAWTDLKTRKIPKTLIGAALFAQAALCIADREIFYQFHGSYFYVTNVLKTAAAGTALFVVLALVSVVSRGGIGMGDARLLFVICMYAGPRGAVVILFFALAAAAVFFFAAAIYTNSQKKTHIRNNYRRTGQSRGIPLGPAFLAGTVLWLFTDL